MKVTVRDIDHLTVSLSDPETAAQRLQKLGFNLTPEGSEPRCICFQPDHEEIPNYIELVEGGFTGVMMAVNVAKLQGERRELSWEGEDGGKVKAEIVVGDGAGPIPWLPVQQLTPDTFMDPEWIVHPNGALGMLAIHAVADDPKAVAKALGTAWKAKPEEIFDGCMLVKTGAVELLIWSPGAYQNEYKAIEAMAPKRKPAIVGIAVAIERARPLQALLRANNVPFALTEGDRVVVSPEQAAGLMIEFMPQN